MTEHAEAVEEIERITRDYYSVDEPVRDFIDFCARLQTARETTQLLAKHFSTERFVRTVDGVEKGWREWPRDKRKSFVRMRIAAQGFQIPPHLDESARKGKL